MTEQEKFFEENPCGVLLDPEDPRDFNAEGLFRHLRSAEDEPVVIPEKLNYRKKLPPIRHQGGQGTCLAQTLSCIKEYQERKEIRYKGAFSPQFLYNKRSNQHSSGMYFKNAMELLLTLGICKEKHYPYGKIEAKEDIKPWIFEKALPHKIEGYAQVHTIAGLKEALVRNGPCVIVFPVYTYEKKFWIQPDPSVAKRGNHAVTVIGYNRNAFILRNSWGENWGKKGYTYYPFKQFGSHTKLYTCLDAPTVKLVKSMN